MNRAHLKNRDRHLFFSTKKAGPNNFLYTTVKVVDSNGSPLADVRVEIILFLDSASSWNFTSDAASDGTVKFTLMKAPSGAYATKVNNLTLINTSQRYDFIIEDEEGNEVWRWSKDMMFAMVLGEETLGPTNTEITYTAEYSDKLSPGYYKITGIFLAKDRPMSSSIFIEVK